MPTDEERREVARRLREYVGLPDDWWADTYSGFYVEKCVFGDVERHRESELFARLADLIEPSCDRDELLALADEIDADAENIAGYLDSCEGRFSKSDADEYYKFAGWVDRIREALGVES